MKEILKKDRIKLLGIFIIIYFVLIYVLTNKFKINTPQPIGAVAIVLIIIITSFVIIKEYKKDKKINYKKIILSIIVIGIILRTVYILYTPINVRQHDVEGDVGHIAYIETIYKTGKLPESNMWQFYHQPLHHIISAGWLKINEFFGVDLETSEEGLQFLTAIYSSMLMLITYCILKKLNVKDFWKIFAILIIAIHPTFIILSGSINNDILLVMMTFICLLYLINWYKKPTMKNTIILAFITALVALTKISGTIIAVPIIYIFINRFCKDYFKEKDKKEIKRYALMFFIFGIISLGLGLMYSIRNKILFNQALFFVPLPGSVLYCGDKTLLQRLTIFSNEWKDVYCHPYDDCNIVTFLIKCSLFGEYSIKENTNKAIMIGMIILNTLIIAITILSLLKILYNRIKTIKEKKVDISDNTILINMFILFYAIEIIMYMYGNIKEPYGCTMDFRYIVPTILLGMIFLLENIVDKSKLYCKIIYIVIILFAILSVIFELTYMNALIL